MPELAITTEKQMLRLAIQKSGRLTDDSLALMHECGIAFGKNTGKLKLAALNFPMEFLFLRDDDIPDYVASGVADAGILGKNVIAESRTPTTLVDSLNFAVCRLSIAVPRNAAITSPEDLSGKRIATSYPNLLGDFLKARQIHADIHVISGSVEIAPSIGLADAICDLVSSGSTLLSNGLKELCTVFESEAALITSPKLTTERQAILDDLLFRIHAVKRARNTKYILLNAPNDALGKIIALLPGMKSPTVLPLAESGWSSVHSVIAEDEFWKKIQELKAAGAQGILVVPIEKMIM
jgi:ATP phosphoribosyltransferase